MDVPSFDTLHASAFLHQILDPEVGCTLFQSVCATIDERTRRIVECEWRRTIGGYYDAHNSLQFECMRLYGVNGFVTVNPVKKDLIGRSRNKLSYIKRGEGVHDDDIQCIRHIFIDIDPKKPKESTHESSTDEELAHTVQLRDQILADLGDTFQIQQSGLWGRSGNGCWILVRLPDYPNNLTYREIVPTVLATLAERYSNDHAVIDSRTGHPARIMGIPGTAKCKGKSTEQRPWRLATVDGGYCAPEGVLDPSRFGRPLAHTFDARSWAQAHPPKNPVKASIPAPPPAHPKPTQRIAKVHGDPLHKWLQAALDRELGLLQTAQPGDRNNALNRAAFALGQIVGSGLLTEDEAARRLLSVGSMIGLDPQEIQKTIQSGIQSGAKEPRGPKALPDSIESRQLRQHYREARPAAPSPPVAPVAPVANGDVPPAAGPAPHGEGPREPLRANGDGGDDGGDGPGDGDGGYGRGGDDGQDGDGGGPAPQPEDDDEDPRPIVTVSAERLFTIQQTLDAMATDPDLYTKSNQIVEVGRSSEGVPRTYPVSQGKLGVILTRFARWRKPIYNPDTEEWEARTVHPPEWAIRGVHGWQNYDQLRDIEVISETPLFRPDGSILSAPGYDPSTKALYLPNCDYGELPDNPSLDQVKSSVRNLLTLFDEFPFENLHHKGTLLAAILTVFARVAINDIIPIFLFDASASSSGKTLLCDLIAAITTGRHLVRTTYSDNDEEMRKRTTSQFLDPEPLTFYDNVSNSMNFGGQVIDALVTGRYWKDRMLATNRMSDALKITSVFLVTGNNIQVRGDLGTRLMHCRLRPDLSDPSLRTFKLEDIHGYTLANRATFVRDCLTILRGWFAAGQPFPSTIRLGRFPRWSKIVRGAIVWAAGEEYDPMRSQQAYRQHDTHTSQVESLVHGLAELTGVGGEGMTAGQIRALVDADLNGKYELLRDVLMEWSFGDKLPSSRQIGRRLGQFRDAVVGNLALRCVYDTHLKQKCWTVFEASQDPPMMPEGHAYDDRDAWAQ